MVCDFPDEARSTQRNHPLLRAPAEIKVAAIVVEWYSSILHEKDF